jgi:hypothetical protein
VTLKLEFSAAEEAKLLKKAEERGVPVEKILRDAALSIIEEPKAGSKPISAEEFRKKLAELQKFLPEGLGSISDEALRRENLYADEGEMRGE